MTKEERKPLTRNEKKSVKRFIKHVERWKTLLQLDPAWAFNLEIFEDPTKAGALDLGAAEYYDANLGLGRHILDTDEEDLEDVLSFIACHEMLHAMTADYHRAALNAAGDNEPMKREIDYRYEQLVSKLTTVLTGLYMAGK